MFLIAILAHVACSLWLMLAVPPVLAADHPAPKRPDRGPRHDLPGQILEEGSRGCASGDASQRELIARFHSAYALGGKAECRVVERIREPALRKAEAATVRRRGRYLLRGLRRVQRGPAACHRLSRIPGAIRIRRRRAW